MVNRYIGKADILVSIWLFFLIFFFITDISQLLFVWPISVVSGTFILTALRT